MATWNITSTDPDKDTITIENMGEGKYKFGPNKTNHDIKFTISYNDGDCSDSTNLTIKGNCGTKCKEHWQMKINTSYDSIIYKTTSAGFMLMTFFVYYDNQKKAGLTKNDFIVTITGEGAPAITDYDIKQPNANAPYQLTLYTDGCDYFGKKATIQIQIKECPEFNGIIKEIEIGRDKEFVIELDNHNNTKVTAVTATCTCYYTGCTNMPPFRKDIITNNGKVILKENIGKIDPTPVRVNTNYGPADNEGVKVSLSKTIGKITVFYNNKDYPK